jgi:hypothetical protein
MAVRQVRGVLFLDYVRMLRARKDVEWSELTAEDHRYLAATIEPGAWYPMATFERMGNAILRVIAHGQMPLVHLWGRHQAGQLYAANNALLAPGDPVETLNRFRVLRETFFDFDALEVLLLHEDEARIAIHYHMGQPAEEAASYQTMGFFESLLELAGAKAMRSSFREKSWSGDPRTVLDLKWTAPTGR